MVARQLRILFASAAEILTDHVTHGEGLIASQLFEGLTNRGHELTVCARRADFAELPPFRVVEIGYGSRFESVEPLAYARRAAHVLRRDGPFDVIHWLFPTEPLWFVPPRAGERFFVGPRLVAEATAGARTRDQLRVGDVVRRIGRPYFSGLRSRALARADHIFLATPASASDLPARFHSKTSVLPFGVNTGEYAALPLPIQPTILCLGRLEFDKGVRDLLEAFAQVHVRHPDSRLVFAGEGGDRAWIERRIRELRLQAAVSLLGAVPHEQTPALLADATVMCLPSHREAYGMAIVEAMSCGRAVVSVDADGPAFIVDAPAGGRLVPRCDPAGLAAALCDVLADAAELEKMGRFNRRRVEDLFSVDRTVDVLERHYLGAA